MPTRDFASPSGESCPICNEWEFPYKRRPDQNLEVDKMGNLLNSPTPHIINGVIDDSNGYITITIAKKLKLPPNFKYVK